MTNDLIDKSPKLITGAIALSIYIVLVFLLVFYFNTSNNDKPKDFVKNNDNRIQVAIATPDKKEKLPRKKASSAKKKVVKKVNSKKSSDSKKKLLKEKIVKKIIKKKVTKKVAKKIVKKTVKIIKTKKENPKKTSDLFSNIKTKTKINEIIKTKKVKVKENNAKTVSASERISNSLKKQKNKDKGIKNAYFAKVQSLLETWPAQSDYVGEKAVVRILVKPTGKFEFKVKTQSNNVAFNEELINFLKQLQRIGLGRHNAGRAYTFDVEFIAKD